MQYASLAFEMIFAMYDAVLVGHFQNCVAFPAFFAQFLHAVDLALEILAFGAAPHVPNFIFPVVEQAVVAQQAPKKKAAEKNDQPDSGDDVGGFDGK